MAAPAWDNRLENNRLGTDCFTPWENQSRIWYRIDLTQIVTFQILFAIMKVR